MDTGESWGHKPHVLEHSVLPRDSIAAPFLGVKPMLCLESHKGSPTRNYNGD